MAKTMISASVLFAAAIGASAQKVPQFVLDYSPIVYLDDTEAYFPSDICAQVEHTHVDINNTAVSPAPSGLGLGNLDTLNSVVGSNNGHDIYLSSNDDYTKPPLPAWLRGVVPDAKGKTNGAKSCAIILNDKGNGTLDAYFMYFYAYNQGNTVFDQELGDHVGDWEHNMVRFKNGVPSQVWYSEHEYGKAFTYAATEKYKGGKRPVAYSGNGTHANWATAGTHDHNSFDPKIPPGLIKDYSSKGAMWDPTLSAYYFSVQFPGAANGDSSNPRFTALQDPTDASAPLPPVNWLYFVGQWGDDQLPASDSRQKEFFGFYKYTAGPTGPRDKQLNRALICPNSSGFDCKVRTSLFGDADACLGPFCA